MKARNNNETIRKVTRIKSYIVVRLPRTWLPESCKAVVATKQDETITLRPVK
jgi:hypothetical protein